MVELVRYDRGARRDRAWIAKKRKKGVKSAKTRPERGQ